MAAIYRGGAEHFRKMTMEKFIITGEAILNAMKEIADSAQFELDNAQANIVNSMAQINTMTTNMSKISSFLSQKNAGLNKAKNRPCFMKVVLSDEEGNKKEFFFTESNYTPNVKGINLVSNKAPIGVLMSMDVGKSFELNDVVYSVCEKDIFVPCKKYKWDGLNFSFYDDKNTLKKGSSIQKSILEIKGAPEKRDGDDDIWNLDADESETYTDDLVGTNIRRRISLRSHPLLDKIQENIYRHPLNKRLALMGPAGTGKTTTLLRRLAQKLFVAHLNEDERDIVGNDEEYPNNWMMFTPTDLLVAYLKDGANKEEVINKSENIKTWKNYSYNLARNILPILSKEKGRSGFLFKDISSLSDYFFDNIDSFFGYFLLWQERDFIDEIKEALKTISFCQSKTQNDFIKRIKSDNLYSMLKSLTSSENEIKEEIEELKEKILKKLNEILRSNEKLKTKEDIAQFVASLKKFADDVGRDTEEEPDIYDEANDEDADLRKESVSFTQEILSKYFYKPLEAYSRSIANSKKPSGRNKSFKIFFENNGYSFDDKVLEEVGKLSLIKSAFVKILSPEVKYPRYLPKRYKRFRMQKDFSKFYNASFRVQSNFISQDEIDILIYSYLYLLEDFDSKGLLFKEQTNSYLFQLKNELKYQIYVDEMTDFTPVQIACMFHLTKKPFKSFFACGDFNQRLTRRGCSNKRSLSWAIPGMDFVNISVNYRQSKKLHAFAEKLVSDPYETKETERSDVSEGVNPVWLKSASEPKIIAKWLYDRIMEIQTQINILPTIAILVNDEDEISILKDCLEQMLEESNIRVEACREGKFTGEESNVRIFSVEHIKGLEFEAVFFINIDKLSVITEQFKKYLYVGATRAATYFGVTTTSAELPSEIKYIEPDFRESFVPREESENSRFLSKSFLKNDKTKKGVIYIPRMDGTVGVIEKTIPFQCIEGSSVLEKQKCIRALHENANKVGIFPLLEISLASTEKEGVELSAFNLSFNTSKGRTLTIETAFHGSKVFELGGPYTDLYTKTSIDIQNDERLKISGKLKKFCFFNEDFALQPRTFFYDWLYINTLRKNEKLYEKVMDYTAFTDIEYDPSTSTNCQAYSVALFVSLVKNKLLEEATKNQDIFLEILKQEYDRTSAQLTI